MELTPQDVQDLQAAAALLWRKGVRSPQEGAVAFKFTQLIDRIIAEINAKEVKK